MKILYKVRYILNIGLFMMAIAGSSRADFIPNLTVDVREENGSSFRYEYTLTNPSSSSRLVAAFALDVSLVTDPSSTTGPDNWLFEFTPNSERATLSWTPEIPTSFLAPGDSAVFSFVSRLAPGQVDYLVVGTDSENVETELFAGHVIGPVGIAVPEPSSLILGIIGGLPIVSWYFGSSVRRGLGKIRLPTPSLLLKSKSSPPHPR